MIRLACLLIIILSLLTACADTPPKAYIQPIPDAKPILTALTLAPKTPLDKLPDHGEVVVSATIKTLYDGDEWVIEDNSGTASVFTNHQAPFLEEGDPVIVKGFVRNGLLDTLIGSSREIQAEWVVLNGKVFKITPKMA